MKRILLIDDERNANRLGAFNRANFQYDPKDQIIIARDYFSAIEVLDNLPAFDILLLDRDLCSFDEFGEKTGEDILKYFNNHLDKLPGQIEIITNNIVAAKEMVLKVKELYQERDLFCNSILL